MTRISPERRELTSFYHESLPNERRRESNAGDEIGDNSSRRSTVPVDRGKFSLARHVSCKAMEADPLDE